MSGGSEATSTPLGFLACAASRSQVLEASQAKALESLASSIMAAVLALPSACGFSCLLGADDLTHADKMYENAVKLRQNIVRFQRNATYDMELQRLKASTAQGHLAAHANKRVADLKNMLGK